MAEEAFVAAAEQPIESNLTLTGDLFVKWYRVPKKGTFLPQHAHSYDHITVLAAGGVTIWQDGKLLGNRHAPASLIVPALAKHTFCTLDDDVVLLCVHRIFDGADPEVIEENHLVEKP